MSVILSLQRNKDRENAAIGDLRKFELLEDNTLGALEVIYNVLYFRNNKVNKDINNSLLLQIALLANKYGNCP